MYIFFRFYIGFINSHFEKNFLMETKKYIFCALDFSELNLFQIDQETSNVNTSILFKPILSDIKDTNFIHKLFDEYKPQVVFHAAAYKHVPIQEFFPQEH